MSLIPVLQSAGLTVLCFVPVVALAAVCVLRDRFVCERADERQLVNEAEDFLRDQPTV